MGKKDKVAIYPYSEQMYEYLVLLKGENITHICTPKAWNRRIAHELKNVVFTNNFDDVIAQVTKVIFCDSKKIDFLYEDVVEKIKDTLLKNIAVECLVCLKQADLEDIRRVGENAGTSFIYYPEREKAGTWLKNDIYSSTCPIIALGTLVSNLDTGSMLLSVAKAFNEKGYRTLTFTNDNNGLLVGLNCFPRFLFENNELSVVEQIKQINRYINYYIELYKPDIVLIPLEYGLLKLNDEVPDNFGVYTYMISQAVSIDSFVLQAPIDILGSSEQIEELSNVCKFRFGFEINNVCFDNKCIDFSNSIENDEIEMITVKDEHVKNYIDNLDTNNNVTFYEVKDVISNGRILVEQLIDELGGN